jgi:hypothetical protein
LPTSFTLAGGGRQAMSLTNYCHVYYTIRPGTAPLHLGSALASYQPRHHPAGLYRLPNDSVFLQRLASEETARCANLQTF